MNFSAEEIIRVTYDGFEEFLKNTLAAEDFQDFQKYKNNMFPSWKHLWENLRSWLCNAPLDTMPNSILSLAEQFQGTQSFRFHLQNSFVLHDEFWNKVYENLLTAKRRLTC